MLEGNVHRCAQTIDDLPDIDQVAIEYRYKDGFGRGGLHHGDMLRALRCFLAINESERVLKSCEVAGIPTDTNKF